MVRLFFGLVLVLTMALGPVFGCASVTRDDFDGLSGRVDKLEQTVYQDQGVTTQSQVGLTPQYPPGGVAPLDPAFAAAFGPATEQKSTKSTSSEKSRYNQARSLLKQKKYAQAATVFSELIKEYPAGNFAPNARYWLGECRYAVGDYSGALQEFKQGYIDYPKSNKAPDYLLKMSYCQSLLGDGPGAMQSLRQLLDAYPDSDSARLVTSGRSRFAGI
jgi:tol-pal system protein YbgF